MRNLLKISLVALSAAMILTGCNCFKAASKKIDQLKVTSTPSPVSLKGEVVPFEVNVVFPAKYVSKKATYKLTPVFVYEGGEVVGEPSFFQGESVTDNYTVISSTGGVAKIASAIKYDDNMRVSTLVLRLEVKCKEDASFIQLADLKAAKGVSVLQNLTRPFKPAFSKDNFKRVTNEVKEANIMFKINSAFVSSSALNNDEVEALEQFIVDNSNNDRKKVSAVHTKAYASPDGPLNFNDKLSEQRAKTTHKAVAKSFKNNKINSVLDVDALGEDWDGFKALVKASDIKEKDMILQILAMYDDPAKRDEEIRNMSSVFTILADKILPQLRRSQMSVNVDTQGYTDEELKAIVASDVTKLNVEEMLFAATLYSCLDVKAKIYAAAADKYSSDFRTLNNLGAVSFLQGKFVDAKKLFNLAAAINSSCANVVNNLGVIAAYENKIDVAKNYFASIADKSAVAKSNLGIAYIKLGKYTEAIKYATTCNKAIAQILVGDYVGAKRSLDNRCGICIGLEGVIAAKEGDFDTAAQSIAKLDALAAKENLEVLKEMSKEMKLEIEIMK